MHTHAQASAEQANKQNQKASSPTQLVAEANISIKDSRPETAQCKNLQNLMAQSPVQQKNQTLQAKMVSSTLVQRAEDEGPLQAKFENNSAQRKEESEAAKPNNTGLPDNLKSGIESLSGMSMDHVKVHYNSPQPAQLNAHAYAQGSDIHIAPGQEQHLPHEAWHVVQQAQGRVKPTMQMKAGVPVNDDIGLEAEADRMGELALNAGGAIQQKALNQIPASSGGVIQGKLQKLRIGITGPGDPLPYYGFDLPEDTNVWILSNGPADADTFDGAGVTPGQNRSSYREIIDANAANVASAKRADEQRSAGIVKARYFQSGEFKIPRQNKPTNRNEYDYSFLRFAAFDSYRIWHGAVGAGRGWPSLTDNQTQVETIDSDRGGIKGPASDVETEDNGDIKADWLAECGVYQWDWTEVKNNESIVARFTPPGGQLDPVARDTALAKFATDYTKAEADARQAKSGNIFKIYFPEPATRLSPSAMTLLMNSGFANMAVTRGEQLGRKRESIGLIAGLVALNMRNSTDNESRSKAKLKYNKDFKVTTGLGNRKSDYAGVFLEWHSLAQQPNAPLVSVDFSNVAHARGFDQSYLDPGVADNVLTWHTNTLTEFTNNRDVAFFKPKS